MPLSSDEVLPRAPGPFLYKYGSAEHLDWLQRILLRHQIYFPSPSQLNDSADARPKLSVSSKEGALRNIVNPFLAGWASEPLHVLARDIRNIKRIVDTLDLEQLAAWMTPSFHEQMENQRIYSMTTRDDNEYLWEHYAGDHTGYCLEFQSGGLFGNARMVIYGDAVAPDFANWESFDGLLLFRKAVKYAPEEEARVLLSSSGQPHEVRFDPLLLSRVILGRTMSDDHRGTIREWCQARVPELLVTRE